VLVTFALTLTLMALVLLGPKIGVNSYLTCGVTYDDDFTQYTEVAANLTFLLIVPWLLYKSFILTNGIAEFIQQSFSYYSEQLVTYVVIFSARIIFTFVLQVFSIAARDANHEAPTDTNLMIREADIYLCATEVSLLALLISLN